MTHKDELVLIDAVCAMADVLWAMTRHDAVGHQNVKSIIKILNQVAADCILAAGDPTVKMTPIAIAVFKEEDLDTALLLHYEWTHGEGRGTRFIATNTDFRGLNFKDAYLPGAVFVDCNLAEIDFDGANLKDAEIIRCFCFKTDFSKARIENVDFYGSDLTLAKGVE